MSFIVRQTVILDTTTKEKHPKQGVERKFLCKVEVSKGSDLNVRKQEKDLTENGTRQLACLHSDREAKGSNMFPAI